MLPFRSLALTLLGVVLGVVALGCAADEPLRSAEPLTDRTLVSGLEGPTQLAIAPDGAWYIAQLVGEENDERGEIVRIDPAAPDAAPVVVRDGLDKPTGVAVFANRLWVMERDRLSHTSLDGSDPVVVVDEMVTNGRSQGTLTVDGDRLLFDTSGRIGTRTPPPLDPQVSSGVLWSVTADGTIASVADGLKHAYHQFRGDNGVLWTTELADGTYDGQAARDEVLAVDEGAHHGWPFCVGDNRPVEEFATDDDPCADIGRSQAVFAFGATPTALVAPPWAPDTLLVALWNRGEVVSISADPAEAPATSSIVSTAAERPQHLVVDGERVLLVDHAAGRVLALEPRR